MQDEELEYVGFWLRTGATLIDTLLILMISVPLLLAAYGWAYFDPEQTGIIAGPLDFLVSWVFPAIAVIVFWINRQATPGKMAISARVVDATTGGRPSTAQLVGRYFAYYVSAIPLCLGFLWVAFDAKKQGWHDKLACTVVVRPTRRGPVPVRFGQK